MVSKDESAEIPTAYFNGSYIVITLTVWLLCIDQVVVEILGQTEILSFGFYTLHVVDIPILFSIFSLSFCALMNGISLRILAAPAIILLSIIIYNFIEGFGYSSGPALIWARNYFSLGSIITLGFTNIKIIPIRYIKNSLVFCSVFLMALTILRLCTTPNLLMINGVSSAEANDGGRPLSAQGAFLIAVSAIWVWSDLIRFPSRGSRKFILFAISLPLCVIATRQGTATICLVVGLAIVFMLESGPSRLIRAFISLTGLLVSAATGFFLIPLVSDQLALGQRAANLGTRQAVWRAVNEIWPSLPTNIQMWGFAAGQAPVLNVELDTRFSQWQSSLHSMYYQLLFTAGIVGLICYCVMVVCLISLSTFKSLNNQIPAYAAAFCLMTAIFGYSYDLRGEQLIGFFVAIMLTRRFYRFEF